MLGAEQSGQTAGGAQQAEGDDAEGEVIARRPVVAGGGVTPMEPISGTRMKATRPQAKPTL